MDADLTAALADFEHACLVVGESRDALVLERMEAARARLVELIEALVAKGLRHAVYTGWVAGLSAMRHGDVKPVVNGRRPEFEISLSDVTVRLLVPEPPDDWSLL